MKITLAIAAACRACDWSADGASADKAAERHTRNTGHPTITRGTPA